MWICYQPVNVALSWIKVSGAKIQKVQFRIETKDRVDHHLADAHKLDSSVLLQKERKYLSYKYTRAIFGIWGEDLSLTSVDTRAA